MNLTNRHGLPDAIFRAVQGFDRDYENTHKRRSDISATTLLNPPQAVQLNRQHFAEIEEDASDRLWALLGQAVHAILAKAETSALTENRLYMDIGGWTVSGQYDRLTLLPTGLLQDYKVCSVWEVIYGLKKEREAQLNVLAELCAENGHEVTELEIVAILRDWQKAKAENDREYPQAGFARLKVPLWPRSTRRAFIEARVRLHQQARGGVIAPCSDEDRWYSGEKWAVMKRGRKSALRVFDSKDEAEALANEIATASVYVEHRPGVNKRCESYCRVAPFCPQWLAMNNAAIEAARLKAQGRAERGSDAPTPTEGLQMTPVEGNTINETYFSKGTA